MRRLRSFGRRNRGDDDQDLTPVENNGPDIEPFVPVAASYDDDFDDTASETETVDLAPAPRRRLRVPRWRAPVVPLGVEVRWDILLLALLLIVGGVFGTLLNQDRLRADVKEWWPLVLVAIAGLWMLMALARQQVAAFLGGSAFLGVGLSALMNNQGIADIQATLLGMVLVTAGLGIVIRGFLLRQDVSY